MIDLNTPDKIRVVLVADGDPSDVLTNSGLPEGILSGLQDRSDVEVIGLVDSTPPRHLRLFAALMSVRLDRQRWRNVYRKGRVMRTLRSRRRDRLLAGFKGDFLVVQVGNTYRPAAEPYVVVVDGTASLSQSWPQWSLPSREQEARTRAEQAQFDGARFVFTLGPQVRDEVVRVYGQPEVKVAAIGGGARHASEDAGLGTQTIVPPLKKRTTILFVGVDFERKGGDLLLEAFGRVRATDDVRLVVAGCDPRPPVPGVEFRGFVADRSVMDSLYQDADIFCLPSRFEPFGLVVHEAMHFGVACIVSDRGALPGLVQHGDAGVVVPAEDVDGLEIALRQLVRDPARRARLGERARQETLDSTWERVAQQMISAIRQAESPL